MNNEDLVLKMILDESGFSAGMDKAVKQLGKFDGQVENTGRRGGRSLGGIWTSFVGNFLASGATKIISTGIGMISSSVDGAINRVDTLANSNRVFENMGFTVEETRKVMKNLEGDIKGLPTTMDGAIKGVQLIASSTEDLGKSEKIFAALNNGILGFGGNAEMVDNAVVQLSQSFSNGKVDAQTWNSMINSGLGPALNALAKQMGLTAGELKSGLSEGSISVNEFQDALINLNKNGGGGLKSLEQIAQDSTAGIKTGLANMKTAVVRGVANVITSIDEGLKGAGFSSISEIIANKGAKFESMLTNLGKAIPGLLKGAKDLYDTLEPFAPLFIGLAAGIATMTAALKIQQTIESVSKAFKAWETTTKGVTIAQKILNATILANPIALAIGAVVALTAGLVYLWKTNEGFRNAVIKAWGDIKQAFADAAEGAKKAWESTKQFFSDLWSGIKEGADSAVEGVKNAWQGAKDWFSDTWNGIKEGASNAWSNVTNSATTASNAVKSTWGGVKDWFSDLWGGIKESSSKGLNAISEAIMSRFRPLINAVIFHFEGMGIILETVWTNLIKVAKNLFIILKNVILAPVLYITTMLSGSWEETKDNMIAVWNNIVDAASGIWGSLVEIFQVTFEVIRENTIVMWDSIKIFFEILWSDIVSNIKDIWIEVKYFFIGLWIDIEYGIKIAWIEIKYFFKGLWREIKNNAIEMWESLKEFFENLWVSITEGVKNSWNSIKDFTKNTWDNIINNTKQAWSNIKNFVVDTANNLVNGAKQAWEDLKQSVSETTQKVKDTFEDLKNIDLFEIGKNIIQGLIDGIGNMIGAVTNKIQEVAGSIKDGLKGALDIHSPSRWAQKVIGRNLPLGVVEGIEDEQKTLDNAVRKMADLPTDIPTIKVKSVSEQDTVSNRVRKLASEKETKSGDVFNINLQSLGELSELQLMRMAEQLVKYIKDVKDREDAPKGGALGGI